ncbi:MAG: hypothetical protein Q8R28_09490 [Dehalococcoidia bacterium]|nr:hypothetical protein [Dehalococcoidia bacterium]
MIYWAPLLHFYQPPTQIHWVLDRICDESYRPLIKLFDEIPTAKVTININAVLTELLRDHGKLDIIEGLANLAKRGQVEFTGSAKYHPILPLVPQDEGTRQITQNWQANRSLLGSVYNPQGFFPPEMAYGREIASTILETGHRWVILSGVACPVEWPLDVIHYVPEGRDGLSVLFRDDLLSNEISFQKTDDAGFINHLRGMGNGRKDAYIVTAMDAETFGHHIKTWEKLFLEEVYEAICPPERPDNPEEGCLPPIMPGHGTSVYSDNFSETAAADPAAPPAQIHAQLVRREQATSGIESVTISQLLDHFPRGKAIQPFSSSWSTSGDELRANNPFPLWSAPGNEIHRFLWEHLEITIRLVKRSKELADNEGSRYYADIARALLDRALHSDQFWWASKRPWWDINLINRGLISQFEAILNGYKAVRTSGCDAKTKTECYYMEIAARDLRNKIRDQLFGS